MVKGWSQGPYKSLYFSVWLTLTGGSFQNTILQCWRLEVCICFQLVMWAMIRKNWPNFQRSQLAQPGGFKRRGFRPNHHLWEPCILSSDILPNCQTILCNIIIICGLILCTISQNVLWTCILSSDILPNCQTILCNNHIILRVDIMHYLAKCTLNIVRKIYHWTICVTFCRPIWKSFQRRPSHPNHHLWKPLVHGLDHLFQQFVASRLCLVLLWKDMKNSFQCQGLQNILWLLHSHLLTALQRRGFGPEDHLWELFRTAPQKAMHIVLWAFGRLSSWFLQSANVPKYSQKQRVHNLNLTICSQCQHWFTAD